MKYTSNGDGDGEGGEEGCEINILDRSPPHGSGSAVVKFLKQMAHPTKCRDKIVTKISRMRVALRRARISFFEYFVSSQFVGKL